MDQNYPSNSNKSKIKVEKKVEKVTEGEAVLRKRPLRKRVLESIFATDGKDIGSYVLFDVVIPAIKDTLFDVITGSAGQALGVESRRRSRAAGSNSKHISYNEIVKSTINRGRNTLNREARRTHDFDEVILPTRSEAETVLDRLLDLIDQFELATVMDFYSLVGITGEFTDENWGWKDLRSVRIMRIPNGYILDLPSPSPVD